MNSVEGEPEHLGLMGGLPKILTWPNYLGINHLI